MELAGERDVGESCRSSKKRRGKLSRDIMSRVGRKQG
jgi:hypothetical protein